MSLFYYEIGRGIQYILIALNLKISILRDYGSINTLGILLVHRIRIKPFSFVQLILHFFYYINRQ